MYNFQRSRIKSKDLKGGKKLERSKRFQESRENRSIEKAGKQIFPWTPQKGKSSTDHLIIAQ